MPGLIEWPDWNGETAIVVATGPSAAKMFLGDALGFARVIAVKSSWELLPSADVVYGCERSWWFANNGLPQFKGMKVSPSPAVCRTYRDVVRVRLRPRCWILMGERGVLGCGLKSGGGHSGFQAINLAVQFGAKRIVLVGFDMTLANGIHWHKERAGSVKADASRVALWREEMDACAPLFDQLGVQVINATPDSALKNYPKFPFLEAVMGNRWQLKPASNHSIPLSS